jgi:Rieske Fe-S protein
MADLRHHRRGFLSFCNAVLLSVVGMLGAVPVFRYVGYPLRRRGGSSSTEQSFVDVAAVADLPLDEWRLVPLEIVHRDGWEAVRRQHPVWVRKRGDSEGEITVLSSVCPHLGCPVNWRAEESKFFCRCHAAAFSADGQTLAGPSPRSMDPLSFRVQNARLLVRWEEFQNGVEKRKPLEA